MNSKYKGFRLLRKYPGCNKRVGDFEPFTSGYFLNYPEIWEPIYTDRELRRKKLEKINKVNENR